MTTQEQDRRVAEPGALRLKPPLAEIEVDAGRKLADWLRGRGDTSYGSLVDRLVSALVIFCQSTGDPALLPALYVVMHEGLPARAFHTLRGAQSYREDSLSIVTVLVSND